MGGIELSSDWWEEGVRGGRVSSELERCMVGEGDGRNEWDRGLGLIGEVGGK